MRIPISIYIYILYIHLHTPVYTHISAYTARAMCAARIGQSARRLAGRTYIYIYKYIYIYTYIDVDMGMSPCRGIGPLSGIVLETLFLLAQGEPGLTLNPVSISISMYIYMYTCIYRYRYIYIHTHTHTHIHIPI